MNELHVVLGGSGGIGRAIVARLAEQGKQVRAVNRSGKITDLPDEVEIVAADALNRESVVAACSGALVIYHCIHPKEAYSQFVSMTENVVAVAEAVGAKLVMAASVYGYGKVNRPMTEDLPSKPEYANHRQKSVAAHIYLLLRLCRWPDHPGRARRSAGPNLAHPQRPDDHNSAIFGHGVCRNEYRAKCAGWPQAHPDRYELVQCGTAPGVRSFLSV